MTNEQRNINLSVPKGMIDVVLDTDAYNEIDDQFAIAYLLRSTEKLHTVALYAAPFFNANSTSAEDGMERSYNEILRLLPLLDVSVKVCRGSRGYLPDERTPVDSEAARDLVLRARTYTPEHPLYVVAIGAITNIASAILLDRRAMENCVIVWLGGHARHYQDTKEFNMMQDIAAARVVMQSGVPFVQLPCMGVVNSFTLSKPELESWFLATTPIGNYLAENTIRAVEPLAPGKPWSRVIWDVTAVAWLLNDGERFMRSRIERVQLPTYDHRYGEELPIDMRYVYHIHAPSLMCDLRYKLTGV